jgi:hypothetical protein
MVCSVSTCPAARVGQSPFCRQHEHARTAKELGLGPDANGLGAVRCGKCGRAFKDDDYVDRTSVSVKTRKGPVSKWLHAHCDPKVPRPSRRQVRESEKPLLAEIR